MIRTLVKSMLILSESDVRKCLDMKTCLEANRKALIAVATGTAQVPPRLGLQYHHDEDGKADASTDAAAADFSLFKPAALQTDTTTQNMGMKVVSVRSQNPSIGLPLVPATILHIHPATGIVEAVLAATYLTGARTASSSALAVQHTQRIIDHVVIFGAGLQAEQHVHALRTALDKNYNQQPSSSSSSPLLPLPKVTLINRSAPRAESLAAQLHAEGAVRDCHVVRLADRDAVGTALESANVIVTCTNAVAPLWDAALDARIPDDCILTGIGSYTPDMQEVPEVTVDRCSQIWIDAPGAETVGDLKHLLPQQQNQQPSPAARPVMTLLGDVLEQPPQTDGSFGDNRKGLIFFKGVGTAIQDVLTADVVVQRARELRIGTHVDMS